MVTALLLVGTALSDQLEGVSQLPPLVLVQVTGVVVRGDTLSGWRLAEIAPGTTAACPFRPARCLFAGIGLSMDDFEICPKR
jgi:hypothetical protein